MDLFHSCVAFFIFDIYEGSKVKHFDVWKVQKGIVNVYFIMKNILMFCLAPGPNPKANIFSCSTQYTKDRHLVMSQETDFFKFPEPNVVVFAA